jgi:L-iditol 2-dehydrogenase
MTLAAFVEAPFRFTWRQVDVPEPGPGQVVVDVAACGVCGTDVHWAAVRAAAAQPFGHEVAGVVAAVGVGVTGVAVGDAVCLESSTFCGRCEVCRNGRVELCRSAGPIAAGSPSLGFSERMLVDADAVVPADGLPAVAASLAEPLGVAQDLVVTSGLSWDDDVLVVGPGPIGLMAVALARHAGARKVVVSARRTTGRRAELARELGADEVSDLAPADIAARHGRFQRVLVTAPPSAVSAACGAAAFGGTVTYIGLDHNPGATITLDADAFHFNKLQLRASHASPALWLPRSVDLLRRGVIPWRALVTHEVALSEVDRAIGLLTDPASSAVKVVVHP